MIRYSLACIIFLFLVLSTFALAQEDDVRTVVDNKVAKMQKVLNLTDTQADAVRPIIKEYLIKRQTVLNDAAGQGIVDHVAIKDTLKGLKEVEYKKLSKILSEEQLNKWIEKENLWATLNPDSVESSVEDGVSIGASGADFKF